jgi:hypothetical protein
MKARADAGVATQLVDEIAGRFADLGARAIRNCVEDALNDLKGSVSSEDLPEMAARLALVRLETMTISCPA